MPIPSSYIVLAHSIKFDKGYKNVCKGSVNLINTLESAEHLVYKNEYYSFIRSRGTIQVKCPWATAKKANYMAFRNHSENYEISDPYDDYMFTYAWIDKVNYINEECCELEYTVDVWNTYPVGHMWSYNQACYVERMHTVDDTIGKNLETEPVSMSSEWCKNAMAYVPFNTFNYTYLYAKSNVTEDDFFEVNNVLTGLSYYPAMSVGVMKDVLVTNINNSSIDKIKDVYCVPTNTTNSIRLPLNEVIADNWTPKNKKLLTRQFTKAILTDYQGNQQELYFEQTNNSDGAITCAIDTVDYPKFQMQVVPTNYNDFEKDYSRSIMMNNFPKPIYQSSYLSEWIANNETKAVLSTIGNVLNLAASTKSGNVSGVLSSAESIIDTKNSIRQAERAGGNIYGSVDTVNMLVANNEYGVRLVEISQPAYYLKRADDFLTKYGYTQNNVMSPYLPYGNKDRKRWYYCKIASSDVIGYPIYSSSMHHNIPADAMETINNIFRNGVTVWKNHDDIGNYSLDNPIISI